MKLQGCVVWGAMLGVAVTGLGVTGCGKGAVGEVVRPKEQTAAEALGRKAVECAPTPTYAEPLIVDWPAEQRLDLEVAMKEGVVPVAYDCTTTRIVKGCKIEGSYAFAGVSRKEQVVQLDSADELAVNVPLSAGKLGAELEAGRSVDLAMVLIGKRSTSVFQVAKDELQGACGDVTHFVRAATLGAFAFGTSSKGKAAAVGELFGVGASAASESSRSALNKDGSLDACRQSKPDSLDAPGECQSAILLELMPVGATGGKSATAKGKEREAAPVATGCAAGYVRVSGVCQLAGEQPFLCEPTDELTCQEQCTRGHAGSCQNLGVLLKRQGDAQRPAALAAFRKACEGGVGEGCSIVGWELVPEDAPYRPKVEESLALFAKGCDAGSAMACFDAGTLQEDDSWELPRPRDAAKFYQRGCNLGMGMSCYALALMYFEGNGLGKNPDEGVRLLSRACQGGKADECADLGEILLEGKYDVKKDIKLARRAYERACKVDRDYCEQAGDAALVDGDAPAAARFLEQGCYDLTQEDGSTSSCQKLGMLLEEGRGIPKDAAKAKEFFTRACDQGEGEKPSCEKVGIKLK